MTNSEPKKTELERAISDIFTEMAEIESSSEDYTKMVANVTELYSLKEIDEKKRVSPDTIAIVIGNLLGIILIVGHERMNVVTSKALNFVLKLR